MNNIKYINIISQCPYCNSNLTIINNNGIKILKCENNKCNQKLINKLEHFCSKSPGLNIKGLSKATFEKLIDVQKKTEYGILSPMQLEADCNRLDRIFGIVCSQQCNNDLINDFSNKPFLYKKLSR